MHTEDYNARQPSDAETVPNASSLNYSAPESSADDATSQKSKRILEVSFSELPDGTLLEMIENPHDSAKSLLAISNNGQVRYEEKLERGNQVLVPFPKDSSIIRHVRLAKGAECYDSVEILLADIMLIFSRTLDLPWEGIFLLSCFVLSSWLVEKLPVAPYLALVGPPGCGKTSALRILSLLCRRSLLTADISSAAFYEICDRMTSTVLFDEAATVTNRRELFHLLRAGTTQGFAAIRKRNSFKSYGARAVSWLELPDDAALNSRCILITMKSSKRTDLLSPSDPRILQWTEKLQQQLLQFRFVKYNTLTLPKISREADLQPRTRDLFRSLALPIAEQKENCEGLYRLLKKRESMRNILSTNQSAALDFLYQTIHRNPEAGGFSIMNLTESLNVDLRHRGEPGRLSERKFGDILSSLDLTNRTRTNTGYVLWLDRETRKKIHSLASMYGVNAGPILEMSARCKLCQIMSERSTIDSKAKPAGERERNEVNGNREPRARRERVNRRIERKPSRSGGKLKRA